MTLHHLQSEAKTLMELMKAESWTAMDAENKKAALETARTIEGRIRELANLHNKALSTVVRKNHQVPKGQALHSDVLTLGELLRVKFEEIELLNPERYMDPQPDEAVRGVPENVAYFYHLAKHVHDQAHFLAVEADMRHERRREALHPEEHISGLA